MSRVRLFAILSLVVLLACIYRCMLTESEPFEDIPYDVHRIRRALTPKECQRLIRKAQPVLVRSTVSGSGVSRVRTSEQTWISRDDPEVGDVVRKLERLAASLTGVRDARLYEKVQVARYLPGQKYEPHFDACVNPAVCQAGRPRIYRRATLLAYLTDDFQGGETAFPKIDRRVRPGSRGDAVLFYNTDPATGHEIPEALHGGMPVKRGVKWIANVWIDFAPESVKK
jgi:prolyl 4-hydroxylase